MSGKPAAFFFTVFVVLSIGLLTGCEKEGETLFDPDTYDAGPTPQVSSISPADSAEAGTEIEIDGSDFMSDAEKNYVYFGSDEGNIVEASETSLTVEVPDEALGEVTLRVATRQAVDFSNSVDYKIY